jgi:hypothetical protein
MKAKIAAFFRVLLTRLGIRKTFTSDKWYSLLYRRFGLARRRVWAWALRKAKGWQRWQKMSKEALKRCPFCGGEGMVKTRRCGAGTMYQAGCSNVHCLVFPITHHFISKAKAIAVWNKRVKEET